jgi:hypothetical protein
MLGRPHLQTKEILWNFPVLKNHGPILENHLNSATLIWFHKQIRSLFSEICY